MPPPPAAGHVALVLHAHLPYVRHPEHARSLEERWLYEALWEAYLPLLDVLDRLARDEVEAPLTLSISPTLAAMLGDPLLRRRFEEHLERLARLATDQLARATGERAALLAFYAARLAGARATWDRLGGDTLGAFGAHADAGRLELLTTTATHAYLPGLLAAEGRAGGGASVRAQLRLGLRAFERLTGRRARGLWLPECAFDPRLLGDLASAGVRYSVLDAHGLENGTPRPPLGIHAPVLSRAGVAFFGRDPDASRDVWSRESGYPGDPWYREFHRDLGFDLPEAELRGELGPGGTRLMTGLKLHRVTGPGEAKGAYDPAVASQLAREHAAHFLGAREATLRALPEVPGLPPILVAPFDAELFGHWWFEGPEFLEHVLRGLDASARGGGLAATTLGGYLARFPYAAVSEPAASSWGEGGFGEVWAGPAAAQLWRHVHHAARLVRDALAAARGAEGAAGRALDQAIRELLLLQASDWAFMRWRGEMAEYAEARVRSHVQRTARLAALARSPRVEAADEAWLREVEQADRFLGELRGEAIRDAFDPW